MNKRLAFTGSYNTRSGTGALTGALGIAGIGVAGVAIAGNTTQGSSKDHRLLNCLQITVTDKASGTKRLYVDKRPGFAAITTPRSGHVGNAIRVWTAQGTGTKVMSCFGNTNFKLFDGITDKGDGTGKATSITETLVSGTPTLFLTSDDNKGWTYQDGGALTNISDGDFPGNATRTIVGEFAHLGGYPFIMDSAGRIYNGDINSATAWTANSYITANAPADVGIGVITLRDRIVGFCKEHFEVFYNAGNPTGSPLSREFSVDIGCVSSHAITKLRDVLYFIGTTDGGTLGLYAYTGGTQAQKLSPPEIDSALAIAGPSNITITKVGIYGGRHLIVISAKSSTFVYCIEEDGWSEWFGDQYWYKADAVVSGSSIINYSISNDLATGKVYHLNPASVVYQDDGVTITARGQTSKYDGGNNKRKFMPRIDVIADQETGSSLNLSWSDDDYMNFTTSRSVDMSSATPHLTRCGMFRRRAFLWTHSSNTAMRLEALEFDVEQGET